MLKKKNWKQFGGEGKTAALSALIFGIITHLFGLVNILHNYDDITQQPYGYGTGITSGRFMLTILGKLARFLEMNNNLPLVNGLAFLGFTAASAWVIVSVLHIRKQSHMVLIGMLLAAFPASVSTLTFRYTSGYYALSMLLAVLAVWMLQNKRWGMLWAMILTAMSLGIYQAYLPLTIGLYVLLLIQQALTGSDHWKIIKQGLYYCAQLIGGVLLYLVLLKLFLALLGSQLSDYQGVDSIGRVPISQIPRLIYKAIYLFIGMPIKDYCGLASMKLIKIAYLFLGCATVLQVGYLLFFRVRKYETAIIAVLLCAVFPIAVNFIVIMCPDSWIYTIMVYPMVLTAVFPLVIAECCPAEGGRPVRTVSAAVVTLVGILCFCYSYQANVNYTALYYANRQTENYLNSIVVQVRMTPGFDPEKKWAFIGDIDDPLMNSFWRDEITCGGVEYTDGLINRPTRVYWIQNYFGYWIPTASEEQVAELCASEEVQAMPVWPSAGSIQAIGDTMVIKFQEITP